MSPRVLTVGGRAVEAFDSCLHTWLFDTGRRRFRRVPRAAQVELLTWPSEWQPYERVELRDDETFTVVLNREGTRLLSAGWHGQQCACAQTVTLGVVRG